MLNSISETDNPYVRLKIYVCVFGILGCNEIIKIIVQKNNTVMGNKNIILLRVTVNILSNRSVGRPFAL